MSPLLRSVAVGVVQRLGDDALPAWRELTAAPRVGPHARAVLAAWDRGPEPSDADWDWLAVEAAAAALQDKGPDEALTRVWEGMPGAGLDTCLAEVQATGHPDAAGLSRAVAAFAASGAPLSIALLGARDRTGADAGARPRPGLPGLRGVQGRLPARILVRGRPRGTRAVRPGRGQPQSDRARRGGGVKWHLGP